MITFAAFIVTFILVSTLTLASDIRPGKAEPGTLYVARAPPQSFFARADEEAV